MYKSEKQKQHLLKLIKLKKDRGFWHSENTKKKISNNKIGNSFWTEDSKQKIKGRPSGMRGKKQSLEARNKLSQSKKGKKSPKTSGDKHWKWKGGISSINQNIRNSIEYKLWRESVFKRDNYTCIWCGIKFIKGITGKVILNADHIKPFCDYPELRFSIDNGRTLCVDCHKKTDNYAGKLKKNKKYV